MLAKKAEEEVSKDQEGQVNFEIPTDFRITAKLSAYQAIREMKAAEAEKGPCVARNIEETQETTKTDLRGTPTEEKFWKSLRYKDLARETRY